MIDPTVVFTTSQVAPVSPGAALGSTTTNTGDGGFLATFTALFETGQPGVDDPMGGELDDALASSPNDQEPAGDTAPAEWQLATMVHAAMLEVAPAEVAAGDLGGAAAKLESVEAELAELVHRLAGTGVGAADGQALPENEAGAPPAAETPAVDRGGEPSSDGQRADRPVSSEVGKPPAAYATTPGAPDPRSDGTATASTATVADPGVPAPSTDGMATASAATVATSASTGVPTPVSDGTATVPIHEATRPVLVPDARVAEVASPRPSGAAAAATTADPVLAHAEPTPEGREVLVTARGRGDATDRVGVTPTATPAGADADASSLDGLLPTTSVARTPSAPSTRSAEVAASIQRVLDAVEHLENAPPPRQLTLELGDVRLRIALEEGQVRLSLLGPGSEEGGELLEEAFAALAERGFDLGGDGRQGGEPADDEPGRPATAPRTDHRRTTGLRL